MPDQTPKLALPFIQAGQAQKHVTHNEAIEQLDAVVHLCVESFDLSAPPASPAEAQAWAIGAAPTGAWAGRADQIAHWRSGGWMFTAPQVGWLAWGRDINDLRVYRGGNWQALPSPPPAPVDFDNLDGVGINATSDTTNRLVSAADATLLTHAGGGHQLKINKAGAADTASLLFQSNWQGAAEMGLAGNDDFSIKVSADGTSFAEALRVDATTGKVSLPSGFAGSGSAAGPLGLQSMAFTCERNTAFAVGNYLAFGNGATQIAGAVMPFAGRVVAASLSQNAPIPGTNRVELTLNRTIQSGYEVEIIATGADVESAHADFSAAPLSFAAGDAIAMRVAASSNGNNTSVGTFFVVFD